MSFFEYLVGGAFLLGTGYLKAKEGMSCDNDDYKEMNTQQKINALSSGLQTSLQKDIDNTKKNFKRQIKNKEVQSNGTISKIQNFMVSVVVSDSFQREKPFQMDENNS